MFGARGCLAAAGSAGWLIQASVGNARIFGSLSVVKRSGCASRAQALQLKRHKRAERALTTVVATCYLLGVSTRRMEKLVETLGITRLSKSPVSVMAKELDEHVESFAPARLTLASTRSWPRTR